MILPYLYLRIDDFSLHNPKSMLACGAPVSTYLSDEKLQVYNRFKRGAVMMAACFYVPLGPIAGVPRGLSMLVLIEG